MIDSQYNTYLFWNKKLSLHRKPTPSNLFVHHYNTGFTGFIRCIYVMRSWKSGRVCIWIWIWPSKVKIFYGIGTVRIEKKSWKSRHLDKRKENLPPKVKFVKAMNFVLDYMLHFKLHAYQFNKYIFLHFILPCQIKFW